MHLLNLFILTKGRLDLSIKSRENCGFSEYEVWILLTVVAGLIVRMIVVRRLLLWDRASVVPVVILISVRLGHSIFSGAFLPATGVWLSCPDILRCGVY